MKVYRACSHPTTTSKWTTWGKDISEAKLLFGTTGMLEALGWALLVGKEMPLPQFIYEYEVKAAFTWEMSFEDLIEIKDISQVKAYIGIDDVPLPELVFFAKDIISWQRIY